MTLPTADWLAALTEMDDAIAAALAGLDTHEARWPDPTPVPRGEAPLGELEARLTGWDECLVTAGRVSEGLEREFANQAAGVGRWTEAFTGWWERIQQPADQPT